MVFLGLLFKKEDEMRIAAKSKDGLVQNQANTFQWNCIDGLYKNGVKKLCIVNALPVGTYPRRYSDLVIPFCTWEYQNGQHFQLGSINLPIFKQYGRYRACKKLLRELKDKEIIIYSPYLPFLKAVKKLDKRYKVTLIVPDLPKYYDYAKVGCFKKLLRAINNRAIEKCMGRVDRFVLLTEAMKEPIGVGNRPYTVIEGICTQNGSDEICKTRDGKKTILYAGSLNKQFGIDVLVDAFQQIEGQDYELLLCGGGDYQDTLQEICAKDSRIKFLGFLPKAKVLELQSRAAVLVNPRQNVEEYTKYSFPSKTMEYLLSGIPVIAYKLDGIPDEYDRYFYYVKDNTPKSLAKAIVDVCEDTSGAYERTALNAIDFIRTQKNPQKQAGKILDLINEKE